LTGTTWGDQTAGWPRGAPFEAMETTITETITDDVVQAARNTLVIGAT
jgi:hypothetical protein